MTRVPVMLFGMTVLCRLRIEVPDAPGALASIAGVLGEHDANILDVAVHEINGPTAIDEVVVAAPEHWDPAVIEGELAAVGATLISSAPCDSLVDPVVGALERAGQLFSPAEDWLSVASAALAHAAAASTATVLRGSAAQEFEVAQVALTRGAPAILRTARFPDEMAASAGQSRWLMAAGHTGPAGLWVGFAARPLSLRFTATEVARFAAVISLVSLAASWQRDLAA